MIIWGHKDSTTAVSLENSGGHKEAGKRKSFRTPIKFYSNAMKYFQTRSFKTFGCIRRTQKNANDWLKQQHRWLILAPRWPEPSSANPQASRRRRSLPLSWSHSWIKTRGSNQGIGSGWNRNRRDALAGEGQKRLHQVMREGEGGGNEMQVGLTRVIEAIRRPSAEKTNHKDSKQPWGAGALFS